MKREDDEFIGDSLATHSVPVHLHAPSGEIADCHWLPSQ
jgi:hypothetical protein